MSAGPLPRLLAVTDLIIHAVGREDAVTLFRWLNAADRREASFQTTKPVGWEDHINWLERQLANPDCWQAIAFQDGSPAGQVRIEREGYGVAVSIYVDTAFRNRRIGRTMLDAACKEAQARWPGLPILAHIRTDNRQSVSFFKDNGFQDETRSGNRITLRRG